MPKTRVVVLNASYEVLGLVPLHRAINFLVAERVDVVVADETRLFNQEIPLPLVVVFKDYIKVPIGGTRNLAKWSRALLLQRDNYKCGYCGKKATTADHILPKCRGGENTWLNTVAACFPCNNKKCSRTPAEAKMPLLITPRNVYREETLWLAIERVARQNGRLPDYQLVIPQLAKTTCYS